MWYPEKQCRHSASKSITQCETIVTKSFGKKQRYAIEIHQYTSTHD